MNNDFFTKMCKEAASDLANGESWREADIRIILLACFGTVTKQLNKRIWFLTASVCAGVVAYFTTQFI